MSRALLPLIQSKSRRGSPPDQGVTPPAAAPLTTQRAKTLYEKVAGPDGLPRYAPVGVQAPLDSLPFGTHIVSVSEGRVSRWLAVPRNRAEQRAVHPTGCMVSRPEGSL